MTLNLNKILGRLASRHYRPPPHERGPARDLLSERVKALVHSSRQHRNVETEELCHQIESFHTASLHVEYSKANLDAIKLAVKAAFELTVDGFSLLSRLQEAKVPFQSMDRREVREINKLGNYWRICFSLAHLSRSYRSLFASLRLEFIEPFEVSTLSGTRSNKTRHIHAEVQILVHYENKVSPPWPRAIGVSKEACFLCSSFIKSHGLFYISKAHRQVYSQWTVPDLREYNSESLGRLRKALLAVSHDVNGVLRQARQKHNFRPFPLQSSINLQKPWFPTPSVTTVHSLSSRDAKTNTVNEIFESPPKDASSVSYRPGLPENDHSSQSFKEISASSKISAYTSTMLY